MKSHIFRPPSRDKVKFTERFSPADGDRLFHFAVHRPRGDNLYRLIDGSHTIVDPRRPELISRTYLGGHEYFLADDEIVELTAAGYGANIT
jgi:hypothetical protein